MATFSQTDARTYRAGGTVGSQNSGAQARLSNITQAYNAMAEYELWAEPLFQMIATKKGEAVTHRGSSIQFFFMNDLQPTKTPLNELRDVQPITSTDQTLVVAMDEYGAAVQLTALTHAQSMWQVQVDIGNLLARQMRDSLELIVLDSILLTNNRYRNGIAVAQLAKAPVNAGVYGTNTANPYGGASLDARQGALKANGTVFTGAEADAANRIASETTAAGDATWDDAFTYENSAKDSNANKPILNAVIDLFTLRRMGTDMRKLSVRPLNGAGAYMQYLHPDCCLDLLNEGANTDNMGSLIGFQVRQRPGAFEAGTATPYAGLFFIESSRVPYVVGDSGTGLATTTDGKRPDIYLNPLFGADGIAKAYSTAPGFGEFPRMVISPVTDALRRFNALGWYGLYGFRPYRGEAVRILECKSTNAQNV
ncbi:MAG: hypothetical protein OXG44_21595 [Gammaproteobacteria bacterium]|nr:hypothetical protein [Gammaproteobacteria bacterium]